MAPLFYFCQPMTVQKLTPSQAIPKVKQYCTYQERCHSEVRDKLSSYGVYGKDAEEIIAMLVEENYLDEGRFAIQFAGGRFRLKQWGRVKIAYELKQKQVSSYCIQKALAAIDEEAYYTAIAKLAGEKLNTLKSEKNQYVKKRKLQQYLVQKGYESGVIAHVIGNVFTDKGL
jgi:regulatory protein